MIKKNEVPIFWKNPYQKEIQTNITSVKGTSIQLSQDLFYPAGGGQLSDTGSITIDDNEYRVLDTYKNESGIWYKIDIKDEELLQKNQDVLLKLNWERRYSFMKAHSAQHLVSHLLNKLFSCDTEKANFEEGKIEIVLSEKISLDQCLEVLEEANALIYGGVEVLSIIVNQETYRKEYLERARGKESYEEVVRMIQLGEKRMDLTCCGGVHVNNLSEIKGIFLESLKENTLKLHVDKQGITFANLQRKLMIELEDITTKKGAKLLEMIRNKIEENEILEESNVSLLKLVFKKIKLWSEKLNEYNIVLLSLPEIDRQAILASLKELEKDVFVVLLGRNEIMYLISTDERLPAKEIVKKIIDKTDKKGGGNPAFAQVSVKDVDKPFELVKSVLTS
ncbi:MAG: alanine--tRNA ligase-related protein [Candidatus Thorarchaeota archaeon]